MGSEVGAAEDGAGADRRGRDRREAFSYSEVLVANTWACNLGCSYCFVQRTRQDAPGREMTSSTAERVIDALDAGLRDTETICVHLYGGEPLTNLPAIRAMLARAKTSKRGRWIFAVTTNGTIASPEAFELLDQGHFYVILSIDGPPAVHDECRRTAEGEPTHAKVLRFLEELRARTRCHVRGSAVVRSGWSLHDAERYLGSLPVDAIKAQAIRVRDSSPLALNDEERREYLAHLEALGQKVIDDLEAGRRPRDDRFSPRVFQLLTRTVRHRFCDSGISQFGIVPDGTVLPCVLLDANENRLGHVDEDPDGWRRAGRAWARAREPAAECGACDARPLCGGGCPAIHPVCGDRECEIVRKTCEVAREIYDHFSGRREHLLGLAGIF